MSWTHNTNLFKIVCDCCERAEALVTGRSSEGALRLFTKMGWKRVYVKHASMHLNHCPKCLATWKKNAPKPTKLFTRAEWRTIVLLAATMPPNGELK